MPPSLAALLVCVAGIGLIWAVLAPPWQAPDEGAHVAYVQSLVERGSLPGAVGPLASTEQVTSSIVANTYQVSGVPLTDPEWSPLAAARLEHSGHLARDDGGGVNPAASNPPLYYLYDSLAYRLAAGGDIWTRMLAMRLGSVLCLLVTVLGAWLLAGQLFARDRRLQLVTAGFTGLLPMMTFISSSVNPDAMMIALWTLALWLGTATLRERDWRTAVGLALVTSLALVTKPTSYALIGPVLLVLAITAWRTRREVSPMATARRIAAAGAALALPIGAWLIAARIMHRAADTQLAAATAQNNVREFMTYLWQFYLPALPSQTNYAALHPAFQTPSGDLPLYGTWIKTGWAAFGYLEVQFADPVYWVFAALTAAVVVAVIVSLGRRLRRLDWGIAAFYGSLVVILLLGLHWTEYRLIAIGQDNFVQGRYLLPVAALGGLAVAQATRLVPAAARLGGQAAVLGALLVLQFYSLALVMARYFA